MHGGTTHWQSESPAAAAAHTKGARYQAASVWAGSRGRAQAGSIVCRLARRGRAFGGPHPTGSPARGDSDKLSLRPGCGDRPADACEKQ